MKNADIAFLDNDVTGEKMWYDKNEPIGEDGKLQLHTLGKMNKVTSAGDGGKTITWDMAKDLGDLSLYGKPISAIPEGSNITSEEDKAAQKKITDIKNKLVSGDLDWSSAYDILLNEYGTSNPELFQERTPEEITTKGGDPNADKSYADILLNKKKYSGA